MNNRFWIIGIIIVLTNAQVSIGKEGRTANFEPVVSTIAGQKATPGSDDGTGQAARFGPSAGITTDGINLYVADTFNHSISVHASSL